MVFPPEASWTWTSSSVGTSSPSSFLFLLLLLANPTPGSREKTTRPSCCSRLVFPLTIPRVFHDFCTSDFSSVLLGNSLFSLRRRFWVLCSWMRHSSKPLVGAHSPSGSPPTPCADRCRVMDGRDCSVKGKGGVRFGGGGRGLLVRCNCVFLGRESKRRRM